ncbi:MAG: MFS transporter [Ignavibacteriaceae bacterium]
MTYWRKNLFIMWVCQFLAMVGMSSIVPFLPLFVRELGVTDLKEAANWSGFVFAGPFFVSFFLAPVWGSLGDKYGRKIMTLRAVFGLALAQVIIGFSGNVTHLFIGRMLQGALSGFLPAAMALVAANTPEEKTGYALGLLQSANAAGTVLGPLIGGVVSDLIGFRNVFFFVAGLIFLSGLLVLFFVKEEAKVEGNEKYSFMQNWKYLLQKKSLLIPSLMITLAALGVSFVRPIFVFYVETLKINTNMLPTITGALYSIVGIFSIISAAWWGRRVEKTGLRKNLIYASVITAITYMLHSIISDPFILIPVRIMLGFGIGALMPLLFTAISTNITVDRRGGVLGVASSFQIIGNMVGPIAGGLSVGLFGLRFSFLLTGTFYLLLCIMSFLYVRDKPEPQQISELLN